VGVQQRVEQFTGNWRSETVNAWIRSGLWIVLAVSYAITFGTVAFAYFF
jgi:hypothetical protein